MPLGTLVVMVALKLLLMFVIRCRNYNISFYPFISTCNNKQVMSYVLAAINVASVSQEYRKKRNRIKTKLV